MIFFKWKMCIWSAYVIYESNIWNIMKKNMNIGFHIPYMKLNIHIFFLQIYDAVFPYTIYGPPYMIFFGANIWYFISNIMHDLHIWYFDDKIYENKNHMW